MRETPKTTQESLELFKREPGPWLSPLKKHLQDMVIEGNLRFDDRQGAIDAAKSFVEKGMG